MENWKREHYEAIRKSDASKLVKALMRLNVVSVVAEIRLEEFRKVFGGQEVPDGPRKEDSTS